MPLENFEYGKAADISDSKDRRVLNLDRTPYQANTAAPLPMVYKRDFKLEKAIAKVTDAILSEGKEMADPTREEIQAQIAASEARGETKLARFEGKLDRVLEKLEDVNENVRSSKANQWVIALGLAVLIVAVVALFPVFFGIGVQLRDLVHSEVQSQAPSTPASKP